MRPPGLRKRAPLTAAGLLLPPALILFIGMCLFHEQLWVSINPEDCGWIQGDNHGFPNRWLQIMLLHRWLPPRAGGLFEPYYALTIGLHLLTSLLIYALFHLLVGSTRCRFPRGGLARHVGAAAAALLFLCYHSVNIVYLSAVSYQLVTVATLLALVCTLAYLTRPHPLLWLPVAAATALALLSHAYGAGVIALVGLCELVWWRTTPGRPAAGRWWLRYGLLAGVMAGYMAVYGGIYMRQVEYFGLGWGDPLLEPLRLGRYLELSVLDLARNVQVAYRHHHVLFAQHLAVLPWHSGLTLLGALALGGLAIAQLKRRRHLDIPAAALLFGLAWCGLAFVITRRAQGWDQYLWRYTFNAAGLSVAAPFALLSLASRLAGRGPGWRSDLPALLLAGAMVILAAPGLYDRSLALGRTMDSGRWGRNVHSCRRPGHCAAPGPRLSRAQVAAAARAGRSLACARLSGLDLSGLDLSGLDLRGADLSLATLQGTRLDRARLGDACLSWAAISGATFQGADLSRATLAGARLQDLDLTSARTHEVDAHCHSGEGVRWPPGTPW